MGGSLLFSSHVLLPAAWEGWLYPCPTSETDPQDLKAQKWRENETCMGSPKHRTALSTRSWFLSQLDRGLFQQGD